MAFVPEDGTGLTNANSLAAVADADAYWAARAGTVGEAWTGAAQADKESALVRASDYIRNASRYRWSGGKKTDAQTMPWPRTGAVERDGNTILDTIVHWRVKEATSLLAGRALTEDLLPDLDHGGKVRSEKVSDLSTDYAPDAPGYTVIQFVDGILAPLLRAGVTTILPVPVYTEQTIPDGYQTDQFNASTG